MTRRKNSSQDQLSLDGLNSDKVAPSGKKLRKKEVDLKEDKEKKKKGPEPPYYSLEMNYVDGHERLKGSQVYVLTAAASNSPPNQDFIRALENYRSARGGEMIVIPVPRTARFFGGESKEGLHERFFAEDLRRMLGRALKLNENVQVTNDLVPAQNIQPLTSLDRFSQLEATSIIGSPKQHMRIIPNTLDSFPHVLISTGAATEPNYLETRPGRIAQRDHVYGAIIVEVIDNKYYHFRPIRAFADGSFVDLGMHWHARKDPHPAPLEALVMGDVHVGDTSPSVMNATYEMIRKFKPQNVILHDVFNGHSINHHDRDKALTRHWAVRDDRNSLELELLENLRFFEEFMPEVKDANPDANVYVVASNHHDFLLRWLQDGEFTKDSINAQIGARLFDKACVNKEGDPFEVGLRYVRGEIPKSSRPSIDILPKFLSRDHTHRVLGFQLAYHGDKGGNGSRASNIESKEKIYGKSITGHTHTPGILRNTYVVGTSTKLQLDYNKGEPSSWLNTHGLLWNYGAGIDGKDRGKVQLVNIINGNWHV